MRKSITHEYQFVYRYCAVGATNYIYIDTVKQLSLTAIKVHDFHLKTSP